MTPLLITSALLLSYCGFVVAQLECATKNGVKESCVVIEQCDSMMKLLQNPTPANQALLKQAFCGARGTTPMVCCPSTVCMTPDGALGTCGAVTACPHIVSMLQNKTQIPQSTVQYVQSLRCEGTGERNICCGAPPQPKSLSSFTPTSGKCVLTASPPDPSTECCGLESGGGGNRIFGGNATEVDEYPWLVIIEYEKDRKINLFCGGVLISGRYVMTAGHCVAGDILTSGRPVNVRLGEYDTSKSGADCLEVEGGGTDCTDGEVIVPIETTIPHPEYKPFSVQQLHDIALIRLDRVVEYTGMPASVHKGRNIIMGWPDMRGRDERSRHV
ncbi:phenoloxidase-activating enzyme-like isoform X2 [Epargyreus clarus]|uniref:phenoloxidase-activating enzyme-like isoform X2 n=1 Tax=Epargyreus clarus TaxID=520877 RepID=UPI003C2C3C61